MRSTRAVVVLPLLWALLSNSVSSGELLWSGAKVSEVIDGDTFDVQYDAPGGLPIRIRLYSASTPETGQCFYSESKHYLERLLPKGATIFLEHQNRVVSGRGREQERLMSFVYLNEARTESLAKLLISSGHAWLDARHPEEEPFIDELYKMQMSAQEKALLESQDHSDDPSLWAECARTVEPIVDHVVINEVEQNPSGNNDRNNEWVELYNPTERNVDLTGWRLSAEHLGRWTTLDGGKVVPARGFLQLRLDGQFLYDKGEIVTLYDDRKTSIDSVNTLKDEENDLRCQARVPDGGAWDFQTCSPGKSNGLLRYDPTR